MIRYFILAIMYSIVDMSCAMNNANIPQMNQGIQNIGNYVDTQAIINGHIADVNDILRRHPQEAARLEELKEQIRREFIIVQPGARYGNAQPISEYLDFRVPGDHAAALGRQYDSIIRTIGLNHHLNKIVVIIR